MAVTIEEKVDMVQVLEDGSLKVRTLVNVIKDGETKYQTHETKTIEPDQEDISSEDILTKDIISGVWTQARIDAYIASQIPEEPE